MSNTANMNLPLATVGQTPGPDYAQDVNDAFTLVDRHDHTSGNGVPITPEGLDINTDLSFAGNFAINVAGVTLSAQSSTPGTNTIYESGVDLYYVDGLGNNIQITQNGAVAGTPGSIANLVAPASAAYVSGSSTFVWQSNTNIAANMDFGAAILRNLSPNSTYGLTLQPPTLSSNYTITLPTLPASTSFMQITNSGTISASIPIAAGITSSNIAAATILGSNIAANTIAGSNLVDHTVGLTQLNSNVFTWNVHTFTIPTPSFSVRAATLVNGTLSTAFHNGSVVDGVTLATNDLLLIKNQTTTTEDGVYVVQASGSPVRSTSYDSAAELTNAQISVTAGTVNAGTNWFQNNTLVSLSDPQSWSQTPNAQTFTVPSDVNGMYVVGVGGGGGAGAGGGVNPGVSGGGGGGGGGALPVKQFINVTAGDTLSIVIGAGGLRGGTNGNTNQGLNGSNGASSSLSGTGISLTMPGGAGGGGGGGNNTSNFGDPGSDSPYTDSTGGTNAEVLNAGGGGGGASRNGGNGGTAGAAGASAGNFGGSGGGGGGGVSSGASKAGGAGGSTIYAAGGTSTAGANGSGGSGGGGGASLSAGGNGATGTTTTGSAGGNGSNGSGGGGGCGRGTASIGVGSVGGLGGDGKVILYWLGSAS